MEGNVVGYESDVSLKDTSRILGFLCHASTKWKYIGLCLGVDVDTLDEIEKDRSESLDCLQAMIAIALRSKKLTSVRQLCDVLKEPTINRYDIVDKINKDLQDQDPMPLGLPVSIDLGKLYSMKEMVQETIRIDHLFASLTSRIYVSLRVKHEKMTLVSCLMGCNCLRRVHVDDNPILFKDEKAKFESMDSFDQVWSFVVCNYMSFFSYELLEIIVNAIGSPENREDINEYKGSFKIYLNNFFKPQKIEDAGPLVPRNNQTLFYVKLGDPYYQSCEISHIKKLHVKLSLILGINVESFQLVQIHQGCVELVFSIPSFLPKYIFPLLKDQKLSLERTRVLRVCCNDFLWEQSDSRQSSVHGLGLKVKTTGSTERQTMEENMNRRQWCSVKNITIAVAIVAILTAQLTKSSLYTVFKATSISFSYTEVLKPFILNILFILQVAEYAFLLFRGSDTIEGSVDPLKHLFDFTCSHGDKIKKILALVVLSVIILLVLLLSILTFAAPKEYSFALVIFRITRVAHLLFDIAMWLFVTGLAFGYMKQWDVAEIKPGKSSREYESLYQRKGNITMETRKILSMWFVVHYMIFLVYVCSTVQDIVMLFVSQTETHYSTSLPLLTFYFLYDILCCLLPLMLGLFMNRAHKNFHKNILEAILKSQGDKTTNPLPSEPQQERNEGEVLLVSDPPSPPNEVAPPLLCEDYEFVPESLFTRRRLSLSAYVWIFLLLVFNNFSRSNFRLPHLTNFPV